MPFVADHAEWGRVTAPDPDLGCGQDRNSIHQPKGARAPLTCRDCGHRLHLVHHVHGHDLWFFRHDPGAPPSCPSHGESPAHLALKDELARAARAADCTARFEIAGPTGTWRADVLAETPDGRELALEAQLASQTVEKTKARTAAFNADGVAAFWFSPRKTVPWLHDAPTLHLAPLTPGAPSRVIGGLAHLSGTWCPDRRHCRKCPCGNCGRNPHVTTPLPCPGHATWGHHEPVSLAEVVANLCTEAFVPHVLDVRPPTYHSFRGWHIIPTADRDQDNEQTAASTAYTTARRAQTAEARAAVDAAAADARKAAEARRTAEEEARRRRNLEALHERQEALRPAALAYVRKATYAPDVYAWTRPGWIYAGGIPVFADGVPYGVICPIAGRLADCSKILEGLVLFAATPAEAFRLRTKIRPGQRVELLLGNRAARAA